MAPIILSNGPKRSTTSDEAGTTIIKYTMPAAPVSFRTPYEIANTSRMINASCVPSLVSYAVKALFVYPEQIHVLGSQRLQYRASSSLLRDVLRDLIPWYDPEDQDFCLKEVDPRLWATLAQVFSGLPDSFRTYHIPLDDQYLPLLQQIPSTEHFSLVTILELPDCAAVTDDTMLNLKQLSSLCALDISGTAVTAHGIQNLARTLVWNDLGDTDTTDKRGPWALRILDVRKCKGIDNDIFACAEQFILLTVLDVRGTKCNPSITKTHGFRQTANKTLFYPSSLAMTLSQLSAFRESRILSSKDVFTIHITSLKHKRTEPLTISERLHPQALINSQDSFVVLPGSFSDTAINQVSGRPALKPRGIMIGNSEVLARKLAARDEMQKHERNKEAWYERNQDRVDDDMDMYNRPDAGTGLAPRQRPAMERHPPSTPATGHQTRGIRLRASTGSLRERRPSHAPHGTPATARHAKSSETGPHSQLLPLSSLSGQAIIASRREPARNQDGASTSRTTAQATRTEIVPDVALAGSFAHLTSASTTNVMHLPNLSRPGSSRTFNVRATLAGPLADISASRNAESATARGVAMAPITLIPTPGLAPPLLMEPPVDIGGRMSVNGLREDQVGISGNGLGSFYGTLPRSKEIRRDIKNHRAQVTANHTRLGDNSLMLIRGPPYPSWSTLENLPRPTSTAERRQIAQEKFCGSNRASMKGVDGINQLVEMVKKRKITEDVKPASFVAVAESRNPFRRKTATVDSSWEEDPIESYIPSTSQWGAGAITGKILKPISKIVVPALPEKDIFHHVQNFHQDDYLISESAFRRGFIKQAPQSKQERQSTPSTSNAPNAEQSGTKCAKESSASGTPATDGVIKRSKSKSKPAAFDWNGWSIKPE